MDPEQLDSAMYWTKVIVGAVLTINFALPLYTVVSSRELWDQPMAVIAGNLSFVCMAIGITGMLIGLYDLIQLKIDILCGLLFFISGALFAASKVAHICMAVDQLIAVTRPLHYIVRMRA